MKVHVMVPPACPAEEACRDARAHADSHKSTFLSILLIKGEINMQDESLAACWRGNASGPRLPMSSSQDDVGILATKIHVFQVLTGVFLVLFMDLLSSMFS